MILYNDKIVERRDVAIDIEDRGYQFGDGVYEVIRVYEGQCFFLDEHLDRLERSAKEIRLDWPCSRKDLQHNIEGLIRENQLSDGMVYLQITRGVANRNHLFPADTASVLTGYVRELVRPVEIMEKGIHTKLLDDIRWLRCDIKSLNLLGNVLLKQEAHEDQCKEAILHRDGTVTEGSSTNVFIVKEGKLFTHPATNLILNGITRLHIINLAKKAGVDIIEQPFTIDTLLQADEVFVSSTTMEIVPVVQIDQEIISGGKSGKITKALQKHFEDSIKLLKI
ncbi:D-alanine transaminase [Scopulibacillus darangshiensis]|uniref:D-alanine aminotransferase n=1 Tax=Scopulibacillus darangshiensis TaxID=442528 RepID=A0A4R2NXT4_9BACL|nr:D-amino-acid transaminase [Scopulibacillus darangshiensis]TCP27039.1 D-alanine transaminase [Scopulibacillus darangshiensis]